MGVFPSITAAGPAKARQRLVQAFIEFFKDDSTANGETCEFIRQLRDVARGYNRDVEYLGRYFFAIFCAFVINTVPVTFWTIGHIVENGELLAKIRAELAEIVTPMADEEKEDYSRINFDAAAIRERCPHLLSASHEVLRYVGASTSTLIVHEDIYIDDRYLLKQGALVQISATAIHSDPHIWGPDAAAFDPERLLNLNLNKPSNNNNNKVHPSAYRTFGGGGTLCPGRHLASDEVLVFTAMFLWGLDVEFVSRRLPRRDDTDMLSVTKPREDLLLRLSRRGGMGTVPWAK